jgi:hypothetical protein
MKRLLLLILALVWPHSPRATEAVVQLLGERGNCPPSTTVTCNLFLHGIDTCSVVVNGSSLGIINYPYAITFVTKPTGGINDVIVTTGDFLRRVTTNTFYLTSLSRLYPKRKL